MKKITPNPPETPNSSDSLDPNQLSQATQRTISARLRDPKNPDPSATFSPSSPTSTPKPC